uniref:PorP/SprF family type IX secretion system membrane protein n=1 Tax=Fulvivirga sp. TaxID=1931237 RepID=UPI00404A3E39
MIKRLIIFASVYCIVGNLYGQQQSLYTHYMFNQLVINPAYTGIHEGISVMGLWREQWVGLEGAPSTQVFSIHSPMNYRPVSLGAVFYNDRIGVNIETGVHLSYAYRIFLDDKTQLSFGLKGSITNLKADFSDGGSIIDPTIINANYNSFVPNVGFGLMLHRENFYVSLSSPLMLRQKMNRNNPVSLAELSRHFYALGGYVFEVSDKIILKPNFMFKAVSGAPAQIDLNINALLNKFLWLGLSYRSLSSLDLLLQFQLAPNLQLGYAYDLNVNKELAAINNASHEIMLQYIFELPRKKVETPRYF